MHDCPVDWHYRPIDLNGNGLIAPNDVATADSSTDRQLYKNMGLFFNETWGWDVTKRHHTLVTVTDGLSQTILATENVRTGYDPSDPSANWSSSFPLLTSFYIGNPCDGLPCDDTNVDYSRCNSGDSAINSGLKTPEGESSVPNSWHFGGVNVVLCDGRVIFLNEDINGAVYAAYVSPAGVDLGGSPLAQPDVKTIE